MPALRILLALGVVATLRLGAQELVPYQKHFFSILSDNDAYVNQYIDRYYTAGTALSYTSKEYDLTPLWLNYLSYRCDDEKLSRYEISLHQDIYTPSLHTAEVSTQDHPYAGFLSLDMMLSNRRANSLENLKLQLGVVGPASLAQYTQKFIHLITHNPIFQGWHTQIKNEFIINLHYEYIYKYDLLDTPYFGMDILPTLKVALGSANTFLGAGGRIRMGYNLHSDFGVDKINTGFMGGKPFNDDFSLYAFGGVLGSYVLRDIFIEGGRYNTTGLNLTHFLYDIELGVALLYKGFRFSYVITHQSKQFREQPSRHTIGSIMLNFAF